MPPGWAARAAGWLLLVVPFIPLRRLFGDPPGTAGLPGPAEWALGLVVFAGLAWLASRLLPRGIELAAGALSATIHRPSAAAFRVVTLGILAALLTAASVGAFSRRPLLIDSIVQLFQAKIFATGSAWVSAPGLGGFFATQHMVADAGRWYAQYPPGHPAGLAPGVVAGAPWLVPIVFSLLSAWLVIDAARRIFGEAVARVTAVLLLFAPFFWCFVRWAGAGVRTTLPGAGRPVWILAAGLALGAAFVTRPLTALAVAASLAPAALRLAGPRWLAAALAGGSGFLALAFLYLVFNAATTGDPFTTGYLRLWGEAHGLGFHTSPWGDPHTPLTGLRNELIDLGLLHAFLLEWPVPALAPLGISLAAGWSTTRWDGWLPGTFLAIPAAYFFYWHRDAFLGRAISTRAFPSSFLCSRTRSWHSADTFAVGV